MILALTNPEVCLVIAAVLFVIAGVLSLASDSASRWWVAFLCAGLVLFAFAFVIDP